MYPPVVAPRRQLNLTVCIEKQAEHTLLRICVAGIRQVEIKENAVIVRFVSEYGAVYHAAEEIKVIVVIKEIHRGAVTRLYTHKHLGCIFSRPCLSDKRAVDLRCAVTGLETAHRIAFHNVYSTPFVGFPQRRDGKNRAVTSHRKRVPEPMVRQWHRKRLADSLEVAGILVAYGHEHIHILQIGHTAAVAVITLP